jgi:LPXTG-motif cell wall-anchored protein
MEGSLVKKPKKKGDKEQKLKDADGKEVTAEVEFTASETGDGEVGLTFTFDANQLELPGTSVVAFEVCRPRGDRIPVAVHADINDMGQTVDFPKVGTKASRNRTGETITVTDVVEYRNLTTGYSYTVKGMLVKADGTPLEVKGKKILAETTFKPEKPDGTVTVTFPAFDPYFANEGRTDVIREYKYVVFEEVYVNTIDQKGNEVCRLVGIHKDLEDRNQTVTDNEAPQTGDMTPLAILVGICLLTGIGISILLWKKRKLKKEEI